MRKFIRNATITGTIPALMESILIYTVDSSLNAWILIQSVLFWFTCGFTNYLIKFNNSPILSSILFTVFLSLPWYIAESFSTGMPEHLIPLIVASIIQGLVIGVLVKWLRRKE